METVSTLCRTCLQVLDEHNGTTVQYDIFEVPELAKKLTVCATFNVEPTDEYPKQLCDYCFHKVNEFYEFRNMCIKSMERFARMLHSFEAEKPILTIECVEFVPNVKIERVDEDSLGSGEREFEGNDIEAKEEEVTEGEMEEGDITQAKEEVAEGEMEEEDIMEAKEEDTIEGEMEEDDLMKQLSEQSDEEENILAAAPINVLDGPLHVNRTKLIHSRKEKTSEKCVVKQEYLEDDVESNSEEYSSDEDYTILLPRKGRKRNSCSNKLCCDICPARFRRKERLDAHKREHAGLVPYACPYDGCTKVFKQFYGYREHLKNHEGVISSFRCDVEGCDKVYKLKRTLINHKSICHNPNPVVKPHVCNICGKSYYQPKSLREHEYTHKDKSEWPFACNKPNCTARFISNPRLEEHLLRHSGVKNFVCAYCGVRRATNKELKLHVNTHTRERKYPCRSCSMVFYKSGQLMVHVNAVHKGLKPYKCQYCDQSFAKSYTKKVHERSHTDERPFKCEQCGKSYGVRRLLKSHMANHPSVLDIAERPYKCEECGKDFKDRGGLRKHKKIHLPGNVSKKRVFRVKLK